MRETEAMIGKAARLGIHTRDMYTLLVPQVWNAFSYLSMTLKGILERERDGFVFS